MRLSHETEKNRDTRGEKVASRHEGDSSASQGGGVLAASRCWRGLGGVSSSPMRSRSTNSLILDLWLPER